MRIYCFDIDGTPEWPSGTAVTARDRRTSSSVLLYRSLDSDPVPDSIPQPVQNAMPERTRPIGPDVDLGSFPHTSTTRPSSPRRPNPAALEQRLHACAVFARLARKTPLTPSIGTQPPRPLVEMFSCEAFLLISAPDAATAAPVLSELRTYGLFRDARPILCPRCDKPGPLTRDSLCQSCRQLEKEKAILADTKRQKQIHRAKIIRRVRTLLVIALLIALVATALYVWVLKPTPQQTVAPMSAPIAQFTASHKSVEKGSRVLLTWNTSGLSNLSISPGVGKVLPSGKQWVVINQDTTFFLFATGTGYTSPVTVSISVTNPSADSTLNSPAESIPSAPPQTAPETSAPSNIASATKPISPVDPDPGNGPRELITAALDTWAAAYRANDPGRQTALYAPQVERFFLHKNVDNAYIQSYMSTFYARGSHFTSFSFSTPEITFIDADNARVAFIKNYTIQVASGEIGKVTSRSELHFIRTSGNTWKINFERDFKS